MRRSWKLEFILATSAAVALGAAALGTAPPRAPASAAPSVAPRAGPTEASNQDKPTEPANLDRPTVEVKRAGVVIRVRAHADGSPGASPPAPPDRRPAAAPGPGDPAAPQRPAPAPGPAISPDRGVGAAGSPAPGRGTLPARNLASDTTVQGLATQLESMRVDVALDDATARDVFDALAEASGLQIVPWYAVEENDPGIDPRQRLALALSDVTLRVALEAIADRCRGSGASTWQIHNGLVEVGPKVQLARETARVPRVYAIADLCMDVPSFGGSRSADIAPTPLERWAADHGSSLQRRTPRLMAAGLLDFVVQSVEPEAWRKSDAQQEEMRRRDEREADDPLSFHGQWGSMWYRQGQLVVVAPDFVHRQLAGYDPRLRSDLAK
ncbi:MAG: hypothetical protein U0575_05290 [Phycisphaerales bacterium]